MGSRKWVGSFGVIAVVAAVLVTGATAASAQTSPTAPRTAPTVSPDAGSFPVLQVADLPAGYRMGTSSPFMIDDQSARYPTLTKCRWSFDNPFSGLLPTIYQTTFLSETPVSGLNILIELDSEKAATALYDRFAEAYRSAAKCKMTKAPSTSGSGQLNYGTVDLADFGKLGDDSFGAVITPSSKVFPEIQYVVFRDGASVVQLRVADGDMSTKEFTALAEVAAERAS